MSMKWMMAAVAAVTMLGGTAFAQSSKSAMQVRDVTFLKAASAAGAASQWQEVFRTSLHTSQPGDLQLGVSLEAGLFTDTLVRSSKGTADSATAEAKIEVQVLVDGQPADPGVVTFARRTQTLMAKFGGILEECTDYDRDGTITADDCTFTDEELELILDTMNANSFFFAYPDVGQGNHEIVVQARIETSANYGAGAASASASIGKGSLVVEEVKYIKALDVNVSR